ncbi:hypothetical protein KSP39_PZI020515 [Platanthera zijinensis]|uniref:Cytochrome c oxidase subunit Vb n=1 Tax=Platanthera zijinensis TaxID=2320716 RepID=A0AAP0AZY5_9ASPA
MGSPMQKASSRSEDPGKGPTIRVKCRQILPTFCKRLLLGLELVTPRSYGNTSTEDEHDVVWFWLEKGKPHECPVCSQYFAVSEIL